MRPKALLALSCVGAVIALMPLARAQEADPVVLSADSTIGDLLDDPGARAILAEHLPDFVDNPQLTPLRQMPLSMFQRLSRQDVFPPSKLDAIATDLASAAPHIRAGEPTSTQFVAVRSSTASAADQSIGALLDNPETRAVLAREMPELVNTPDIERLRPMSLRTLQQISPQALSAQVLDRVNAALNSAGEVQ